MSLGGQRRFNFDCGKCPLPRQGMNGECYECALQAVVKVGDVSCCSTCHAPLSLGFICTSCDGRFGGKNLILRRLGVAGLGNTDGHWKNRTWKELGAAVCGYKDSKLSFLYTPLRNVFVGKLYEFLKASDVDYDLVLAMPSSRDLVARILRDVDRNRAAMELSAPVRLDVIAKRDERPRGNEKISPTDRWQTYVAEDLYYVREPNTVSGAKVLLVDDVYKSGCSINLAASNLLTAGAQLVDGFALCRWI